MRGKSPDGDDDGIRISRLSFRRRRLIIIGVIILLAGFVLALIR